MKKYYLILFVLASVLTVTLLATVTSVSAAGGPTKGWSQGMWTWQLSPGQYDCVDHGLGVTEHCRKVVTGLNFHPDELRCPTKNSVSGKCYYIVFNGKTVKLDLGYEIKRNGYSDFMWGVPTSWITWKGKWEFKLMDGTTW